LQRIVRFSENALLIAVVTQPRSVRRQFFDAKGASWDVWDVSPHDLSRFDYDRRTSSRVRGDAPRAVEASVYPELREGWLCFQSATEKRRFAPIPSDWYELPDAVLRVMLDVATPAPVVMRNVSPSQDG
jgi:hypothetical protein